MQTKRKYFVYKEMQSLRIFRVQFFCRKKIVRTDYKIFCLQRIKIIKKTKKKNQNEV